MNQYRFFYLTEVPHLSAEMAKVAQAVWGGYLPDTDEADRERFYNKIAAGVVPGSQVLVALDEADQFAGMAVIYPEGVPNRKDLRGWLYQLYIKPKHRNLGLGSWLLSKAEVDALTLGYDLLHLFTESSHDFYEGISWQKLEDSSYNGRPGTIMIKDLRAQAEKAARAQG